MTAPTETPSLTTEQARGLASRWAFWHAGLKQCADNAEFDREMAKAPMLLAAPEVGQLFAWVRVWMADSAWHPGEELEASCRDTLAGILEISRDDVDALLVSVGWLS